MIAPRFAQRSSKQWLQVASVNVNKVDVEEICCISGVTRKSFMALPQAYTFLWPRRLSVVRIRSPASAHGAVPMMALAFTLGVLLSHLKVLRKKTTAFLEKNATILLFELSMLKARTLCTAFCCLQKSLVTLGVCDPLLKICPVQCQECHYCMWTLRNCRIKRNVATRCAWRSCVTAASRVYAQRCLNAFDRAVWAHFDGPWAWHSRTALQI